MKHLKMIGYFTKCLIEKTILLVFYIEGLMILLGSLFYLTIKFAKI